MCSRCHEELVKATWLGQNSPSFFLHLCWIQQCRTGHFLPAVLSCDDITVAYLHPLQEFVEMAARQLVEQYPLILGVVLSNISHVSTEIQQVGRSGAFAILAQTGSCCCGHITE